MMEILLFGIIIALCGLIGWIVMDNRKQTDKLVNAIIAKNATEMRDLEIAKNTKIKMEGARPEPDLMSLGQATDDQFAAAIKKELEESPEEEGEING